MSHKHAGLMAKYAEDALKSDEPWENWQYLSPWEEGWVDLVAHPRWKDDQEYRRKPITIQIGTQSIPEPVRKALQVGDSYYPMVVRLCRPHVSAVKWTGSEWDYARLEAGFIHLTAEAAEAHADALISLTKVKLKTEDVEYTLHKGGTCPVEYGTLVDVIYRDGQRLFKLPAGNRGENHLRDASAAFWRHDGQLSDITFYRLSKGS